MKIRKPPRRSVSPFGVAPPVAVDGFAALKTALDLAGADVKPFLSYFLKAEEAVAGDTAALGLLLDRLFEMKDGARANGLHTIFFKAMEELFWKKTDQFFMTRYDADVCKKMGWPEESRQVVLNARERDQIVGRYFYAVTEDFPGEFASFIHQWADDPSQERRLHLLDFLTGSADPTFDYFLAFTHPALHKIVQNKALLRDWQKEAAPLIKHLSLADWSAKIKKALG